MEILRGLNHPYQTIISNEVHNLIPWREVKCILWFPRFGDGAEDGHRKTLVQTFFSYLAVRFLADALFGVQVVITMNNMRFSNLEVTETNVLIIVKIFTIIIILLSCGA